MPAARGARPPRGSGGGGGGGVARSAMSVRVTNVCPFTVMLLAVINGCPSRSERYPDTRIRKPRVTAPPICRDRLGGTSTTLPSERYRLRTWPSGPGLKARTRDARVYG